MSAHLCCDRAARSANVARLGLRSAGWIVPGAILAVLPKCPVCFAAYITLLTGAGLSLTAAAYIRGFLILFCVGVIVCVAALSIQRIVKLKSDNLRASPQLR
jgi:hypothetical protein